MVTVKTVRRFADFRCHVDRMPGDVFEVTEERAAYIADKLPGYIVIEESPEQSGDSPDDGLADMTVAQLRSLAKERGITIPPGTKKAGIIEILTKE